MRRSGPAEGRLDPRSDEGSAVVEFLGVALVLLVPLVYLVLTLGRLQAAAFAADGAAREAVRAVTSSGAVDPSGSTERPAGARAVAAVGIALADQGITADPAGALALSCAVDCSAPGTGVAATIQIDVELPLVPGFLQSAVPLRIPVTAHAEGHVERFAQARP